MGIIEKVDTSINFSSRKGLLFMRRFYMIAMFILSVLFLKMDSAYAGIWYLPFPEDISTNGHLIDDVIKYIDVALTVFFGLVVLAMLYFIIFNRDRAGHKAVYDRGDKPLNIVITILLGMTVFLTIDAVIEHMAFRDLKEVFWNFPTGKDVLKIEIMPQQFAWNVRYAGPDGEFATADDIVAPLSQVHVPIDTPVVVQLSSFDVVHSFYVPELRLKQDATPGLVTAFWFKAVKSGEYEIACSALCGNGHYKMRGKLTVESKENFNQWLNAQAQPASADDVWGDTSGASTGSVPANWGWKWQSKT